ncbi:MAG: gamma-glutamyl-gamma-aminobutyrate hydrolase family protein [Chloroflexia bacterium]|nr:gamma-glutamyl-gamma-aminobutyrate hydrolase family protein [Chloroflexia bacterium]
MTVWLIDTEHRRVIDDPVHGPDHAVKIEQARSRIEEAADAPCVIRHYADVIPATLQELAPTALVIGGNTTDWANFNLDLFAPLFETIRNAPVPILGICAGHQLIGFAHGALWRAMGALRTGEIDPDPRFAPGQRKERGFLAVAFEPNCLLFQGLEPGARFFQSHYWQLEDAPSGFLARGSSPQSPVQVIEREDQPVFGVQFHPERYDDAHLAGAKLLRNFFALGRP